MELESSQLEQGSSWAHAINFPFRASLRPSFLCADAQITHNAEGRITRASKWFENNKHKIGCIQADSQIVQCYLNVSRETADALLAFQQGLISENHILFGKIQFISYMVIIDIIDVNGGAFFWSMSYENISVEALIDKAEIYMWKLWDLLCQ